MPAKLLLTAALTTALTAGLLALAPAASGARATPGRFTGYAFDQCQTPSQASMDVWRETSPYWGVGVYIAGDSRFCPIQPNLTRSWVATQSRKGWRILPITVGRQASCFVSSRPLPRISAAPANSYAAARAQGRAEATTTIAASRRLGFAKRTTHWLDIEAFDVSKTRCRQSMLAFVSGWTTKLHQRGFRSGYYSSASSGITALEGARTLSPGAYQLPDQIWIAHWNGVANTRTSYLPEAAWSGKRVHQYSGSHNETYGGVTIEIDSNWMEVGGGSRAPRPSPSCGVRVDFPSYGVLRRGSRGPHVAAAECLLRQKRHLDGRVDERFDPKTVRAVKRFQRKHSLRVSGRITRTTWVALLSDGASPFMKVGSASNAVRRLQRSLNAAVPARLTVSGVYDKPTAKAVKRYQRAVGLPRTSVTTVAVWDGLHRGRR